ncbi:MAG: hypothetical protein V7641_36 [Blastocatellia bacterium]
MNIRMRTNFAFSIPARRVSERFRWALLTMLICLSGLATALSSANLTLAAPYAPATQSTPKVVDLNKCTGSATINFAESNISITPADRTNTYPITTTVYAFSGTVDCSGNIVIPKANLRFKEITIEENTGELEIQEDATGYISPNTGVMKLTMKVKLYIQKPCFLGPITLAMTSTDGTAYLPSDTDGSARLVAKNWPLPAVTSENDCGIVATPIINSSDQGLGLPWATGEASAALPIKFSPVIIASAVGNAGKWQEGEPNNDPAHANSLSGTPIAISGNVNPSDVDYFTIMIPKNTSVTISHSSKKTINSSEPCDPAADSGGSTVVFGGPLVAINGKANYTESSQVTDTGGCSGSNGTKGFMKETDTYTYTMAYTIPAKTVDHTVTFSVTAFKSSWGMPTSGKYTLNLKFLKQ